MKRKGLVLFILLVSLLAITGCWNRRELNDLAIAVAMGIDKKEDLFVVSVQIVNPAEVASQKGGGGAQAPVSTYHSTGKTVFEALRHMTTKLPRKVYLSHLRVLLLGEELAKDGFAESLDLLSRDQELRTDFYVAIVKGARAEKILNIMTPLEKIPANKMFSSLETSEKAWAATGTITLDKLINDLVSKGKHPVITTIELKGNQKNGESKSNVEFIQPLTILETSGMAAFKKDKLVGWIDSEDSKGYNYLEDKVKSTIVQVPCEQGEEIAIELIRTQSTMKGKVENGRPVIDVMVRTEANIGEVQCGLDLTKTESVYQLEGETEKDIKGHIDSVIEKAQKQFKADILGFGDVIHRADPKYWKKVEEKWDQEFEELKVNVKVDVKIRRIGTVGNSFIKELKE